MVWCNLAGGEWRGVLCFIEEEELVDIRPITLFELLSLIVSVAGFVVVIISIHLLRRQISIADRGLRESWLIPLKTQQLEIDKLFIERPHLRKYFYEAEPVSDSKSDEYAQVAATAEYILDHLSGVISQRTADGEPLTSTIWREYIKDSFINSPALCALLEKHRRWYPKELSDIKEAALDNRPTAVAPARPSQTVDSTPSIKGREQPDKSLNQTRNKRASHPSS